jgi:predicted dithiol-disulfide oxidoreductase (DUF899 family)
MRFDARLADAQPDSHALLFCREERFEQPRQLLLAKAAALIGHADFLARYRGAIPSYKSQQFFTYDGKCSGGKPAMALSCARGHPPDNL